MVFAVWEWEEVRGMLWCNRVEVPLQMLEGSILQGIMPGKGQKISYQKLWFCSAIGTK